MKDTFVAGAAMLAVGFALGTAALPPWVPAGPARPVSVGMALEDLGDADGWLVVGRTSLPSAVERARLFVAATCDGVDRRFAARVPVGEHDVEVVVPDSLVGCTVYVGSLGALEVQRLEIWPARRNPAWALAFGAALVGYSVAGGGAAIGLWSKMGRWSRLLAVGVGALVLVGVCLPGPRLDALLLSIPGTTPADLGVDPWVTPTVAGVAQKFGGHGLAFVALGWIGRSSGAPGAAVLARCLGFAVATEVLQVLVPARSGRWEDVVLDTIGAAIGVGISAIVALRAPRGSAASPT